MNFFNLKDTRFGKLIVKERLENYASGDAKWLCLCDCKRTYITKGRFLKKGMIDCCPRCSYEDFTGMTIGKLKVIKRIEDKIDSCGQNVIQWECQCECGTKTIRVSNSLRKGKCCCKKCKSSSDRNRFGYKDLMQHHWRSIQRSAKRRGFEFEITIQHAWDVFEKQNKQCAISSIPIVLGKTREEYASGITTASLDRIDSSKGYIKGNIQWVHKKINIMKSNYTLDEFIYYCRKIVEKQGNK